MTRVDLDAIEGEIIRFRSLGLEDLRREWRRLYHTEPPRISRDLLVLALVQFAGSSILRLRGELRAASWPDSWNWMNCSKVATSIVRSSSCA
jgi:hypothetical protein